MEEGTASGGIKSWKRYRKTSRTGEEGEMRGGKQQERFSEVNYLRQDMTT